MIQTKNTIINGHEYAVTQFPARHGLKIKAKLLKLVGPAAAGLLTQGDGLDRKIDVGGIVAALANQLDSDEVVKLVEDLFASTRRDGKELRPEVIDDVFVDSYMDMYKALKFVLEVNYGSFLSAIGAPIGKLQVNPTKTLRTD